MAQHIELNPLSHFTINTVGEPGQRTFYIQGSQDGEQVSLVIEKAQAIALADSFESLLGELERQYPELIDLDDVPKGVFNLQLRQPIDPLFRVGNLGLGFNEQVNRIVIVAYELVPDEDDPNVVSFWATPDQVKILADHTQGVVRSGRPICGNCMESIDPSGHFCAHRNGYIR